MPFLSSPATLVDDRIHDDGSWLVRAVHGPFPPKAVLGPPFTAGSVGSARPYPYFSPSPRSAAFGGGAGAGGWGNASYSLSPVNPC